MIFRHLSIDKELQFTNFAKIVIENPTFYRDLAQDFLSENEHKYSIESEVGKINYDNIDFIDSPVRLDFNNRQAISALSKKVVLGAISENFYLETEKISADIKNLFLRIIDSEQFNFEIDLGDPSAENLVKILSPEIIVDQNDFFGKICQYLEVMTELVGKKVFVFLGLENFLENDEFFEFIKFCQNHELHVLSIETLEKFHGDENLYTKIIIDADLCVI